MIDDVWIVLWKEYKEILFQRGKMWSAVIPLFIVPIFLLGIFLPWQVGREWIKSSTMLLNWIWLPTLMMTSWIADSFAGERERYTLETLLASRLSDKAILFGKISAAIGYGWGLTLAGMLVGLVTVNLAYGASELLLYPMDVILTVATLSFLLVTLVASAGVLVSLRAPTVRHAQQALSISFIILMFVVFFGLKVVPSEWRDILAKFLMIADGTSAMFFIIILLCLLDIGLITAGMVRFKRARLILD